MNIKEWTDSELSDAFCDRIKRWYPSTVASRLRVDESEVLRWRKGECLPDRGFQEKFLLDIDLVWR